MFEEFFSYETYETFNDNEVHTYYRCKLKKNLGKYWIGSEFYSITILFLIDDMSVLQLRRLETDESPVCQYRIRLSICEELK